MEAFARGCASSSWAAARSSQKSPPFTPGGFFVSTGVIGIISFGVFLYQAVDTLSPSPRTCLHRHFVPARVRERLEKKVGEGIFFDIARSDRA